jgi:hypothetical protein
MDTGNGATVTFGTSGFTGEIIDMDFDELSRPVLSQNQLTSTGFDKKGPGDLVDAAGFTITFFLNPNSQPPISGAVETVTVTFPPPAGDDNGATYAGNAFVDKWKPGSLKNNEYIVATCHVTWEGGSASPTWTDSN